MVTATAVEIQPTTTDFDLRTLCKGQVITSARRRITKLDVMKFAEVSHDENPIHLDEEFAAQTPFQKPIAHGALVIAAATGLAYKLGIAKSAVIFDRIEHDLKRAVYYDDEIRLRLYVSEIEPIRRPIPGRKVKLHVQILNQHDRLIQDCNWQLTIVAG